MPGRSQRQWPALYVAARPLLDHTPSLTLCARFAGREGRNQYCIRQTPVSWSDLLAGARTSGRRPLLLVELSGFKFAVRNAAQQAAPHAPWAPSLAIQQMVDGFLRFCQDNSIVVEFVQESTVSASAGGRTDEQLRERLQDHVRTTLRTFDLTANDFRANSPAAFAIVMAAVQRWARLHPDDVRCVRPPVAETDAWMASRYDTAATEGQEPIGILTYDTDAACICGNPQRRLLFLSASMFERDGSVAPIIRAVTHREVLRDFADHLRGSDLTEDHFALLAAVLSKDFLTKEQQVQVLLAMGYRRPSIPKLGDLARRISSSSRHGVREFVARLTLLPDTRAALNHSLSVFLGTVPMADHDPSAESSRRGEPAVAAARRAVESARQCLHDQHRMPALAAAPAEPAPAAMADGGSAAGEARLSFAVTASDVENIARGLEFDARYMLPDPAARREREEAANVYSLQVLQVVNEVPGAPAFCRMGLSLPFRCKALEIMKGIVAPHAQLDVWCPGYDSGTLARRLAAEPKTAVQLFAHVLQAATVPGVVGTAELWQQPLETRERLWVRAALLCAGVPEAELEAHPLARLLARASVPAQVCALALLAMNRADAREPVNAGMLQDMAALMAAGLCDRNLRVVHMPADAAAADSVRVDMAGMPARYPLFLRMALHAAAWAHIELLEYLRDVFLLPRSDAEPLQLFCSPPLYDAVPLDHIDTTQHAALTGWLLTMAA